MVRVHAQTTRDLDTGSGKDYPLSALVVPKPITFTSPDASPSTVNYFARKMRRTCSPV